MSYEIKKPNAPMTWKQAITIRNLGGGCFQAADLTRQQASDKIGELMAAKNGRAEYYVDEEDGLYHVFHSETGHSHASYANRPEAEADAKERNGSAFKSKPKMDFETLWEEAKADGYVAGTDAVPTPMIVSGYEDQPVMGGVCGFAYVNFSMKKGMGRKFGRWLIDNGHARKDSCVGGCTIWISEHGQSMERKEAHAHAMAETLRNAGIEDAHGMSRMD